MVINSKVSFLYARLQVGLALPYHASAPERVIISTFSGGVNVICNCVAFLNHTERGQLFNLKLAINLGMFTCITRFQNAPE